MKQDIIEEIQNKVEHNRIATDKELKEECEKHGLDWFDDILSPLEWNCCDRCGTLYPSEMLFWESADWGYENEELVRGIQIEKVEYMALCEECVKELVEKGKKDD